MRLFVCEYVTGGGYAGGPLPEGLVREGDRMLRALVADATGVPGVAVLTTRDARLPAGDLAGDVWTVPIGADPWPLWERAIVAVDAVWPVAPETGGLLERLSEMTLAAGRTLVGSRPPAVRLAAGKRATAAALADQGLNVIPALTAAEPAPHGWVVKPDDGAGSEWTHLCATRAEVDRLMAGAPAALLQPYVPGDATSLAMLCREGRAWLLACNSQIIARDGDRLRYRGGIVGGRERRRHAYAEIAGQIAAAIPGLWGYVGVDLIEAAGGPVVVEVNPRVSVPYAGLRQALGLNPAELILRLGDHPLDAIERPLSVTPTPVMLDA